MKGKYAPREAATDMHVPGNHIAFQISAGTKNQPIGTDPPKHSAMDVYGAIRIQEAFCRKRFAKM